MRGDGAFVHTQLAPVSFVVAAAHVSLIAERSDAVAGEAHVDLAELFELEPPLSPRRALLLDGGGWLVVGERVALRRVTESAFVELPAWLSAIAARLPLAGLVTLDDGFAFELDVVRLAGSMRR